MLLAITTGGKVGLGVLAGLLIVFAILSMYLLYYQIATNLFGAGG